MDQKALVVDLVSQRRICDATRCLAAQAPLTLNELVGLPQLASAVMILAQDGGFPARAVVAAQVKWLRPLVAADQLADELFNGAYRLVATPTRGMVADIVPLWTLLLALPGANQRRHDRLGRLFRAYLQLAVRHQRTVVALTDRRDIQVVRPPEAQLVICDCIGTSEPFARIGEMLFAAATADGYPRLGQELLGEVCSVAEWPIVVGLNGVEGLYWETFTEWFLQPHLRRNFTSVSVAWIRRFLCGDDAEEDTSDE